MMTTELDRLKVWMATNRIDSAILSGALGMDYRHVNLLVTGRRDLAERFKRTFSEAFGVATARDIFYGKAPGDLKTCHDCLKAKPLAEFHKDRSRWDELTANCKVCNIAKAKPSRRGTPNAVPPTRPVPTP